MVEVHQRVAGASETCVRVRAKRLAYPNRVVLCRRPRLEVLNYPLGYSPTLMVLLFPSLLEFTWALEGVSRLSIIVSSTDLVKAWKGCRKNTIELPDKMALGRVPGPSRAVCCLREPRPRAVCCAWVPDQVLAALRAKYLLPGAVVHVPGGPVP